MNASLEQNESTLSPSPPLPHTLTPLPTHPLQLFVASVLLEPELALTPMPSPAHHGYGTMASSQSSTHGPLSEEECEEGGEGHCGTRETELQEPPSACCSSPLMDSPVSYQ